MRGAHHGFDVSASWLITPPKGGGGAGSWLPGMVVVAPGEPGGAVVCCAVADEAVKARMTAAETADSHGCVWVSQVVS